MIFLGRVTTGVELAGLGATFNVVFPAVAVVMLFTVTLALANSALVVFVVVLLAVCKFLPLALVTCEAQKLFSPSNPLPVPYR